MNQQDYSQAEFLPEIRLGRLGVLKVHQVSDEELARLEQGSGQSLFLNFGIGVISIAASFLIALCTTKIESNRMFAVFVIVVIVGFLAGIVLMILWWVTRKPVAALVKEIRNRMPPEGELQESTPAESTIAAAAAPADVG